MHSKSQLRRKAHQDPEALVRRITHLERAMRRAIGLIQVNLHDQREKIDEAAAVLREALET